MPNLTANVQGISPLGFKAGAAITKGRLVKLDTTAGQVIHTTAITDVPIGVALGDAASGADVAVQTNGVAEVCASAAVALGAQVMPTASGAGKCSTASGATAQSIGQALALCSNDGEFIPVLLRIGVNGPANS